MSNDGSLAIAQAIQRTAELSRIISCCLQT